MALHLSAFLLFTLSFAGRYAYGNSNLNRVCYYASYNPPPNKLNATLCTHIIAGFSSVKDGVIDVGGNGKMYTETTALKKQYPHLKILMTVGGGGNDQGFSSAVSSPGSRLKLIASAFSTLGKYGFDGLDIDWEFPVWNDNQPDDKDNFIHFLKEFKIFSDFFGLKFLKKQPLLTVAVAAPKTFIDKAYNITEMAKYVDFINLMTYDFHDYFWYTPFTGHNSPLFNRSVEQAYFSTLNTAWSSYYWNMMGMPKSKIMVGIPTYGHTYKLLDPSINYVDAPATAMGIYGGDITFTEVCKFLASGARRVFDSESEVPYAFKGFDWISYEDQASILRKAKWIKSQGFGGAMTYDLNSDDFSLICDNASFPLHRIIYDVFTN
ncbi:acidic mammalian chitinase-like [Uloborus diversus]|uniref:acidic mammalian chitinase-like n=1 Tax=Uloborus diversus TaxID=327109 RepID=UPI00240A24FE|nr:acidic mammalian chitinase-like [Uloborus diversus]XP_054719501.1 acidic mammalian chitinase-like [Uloborus diversus]XP_054719502.1 acidic mammalian chitinase-like [Uloborus diversus]